MEQLDWSSAIKNPISVSQVHIWRIWLDVSPTQSQSLYAILSKEEKGLADRKQKETDKHRYVAAHGRTREILSSYVHIPPGEIELVNNAYGKPFLSSKDDQEGLNFNLSHSDSVAVLAVSGGLSVGVDLEHAIEIEDYEAIAQRYFAESEIEELLSIPEGKRQSGFFRFWTLKEAYIKARGMGLAIPLDQFEVRLLPSRSEFYIDESEGHSDEKRWVFLDLEPVENYIGALVVEGYPTDIHSFTCWGWAGK